MKRYGLWKLSFLTVLTVLLGTGAVFMNPLAAQEVRVFFGSYDRDPAARGIYTAILDEETGRLSVPERAADVENPGFLTLSRDFQYLYAVCGAKKDSLAAFRVEETSAENNTADGKTDVKGCDGAATENGTENSGAEDGVKNGAEKTVKAVKLTELNRLTDLGRSVCYVTLDPAEKNVLTAHYSSSDFALYALAENKSLAGETQRQKLEGHGPNAGRQECSHPHSVKFGPTGCFYVPDLGTDKIMIYNLDAEKHTFSPHETPYAQVEAGSGPRHLCFVPKSHFAYAANELASTVTAFTVREDGSLNAFQTLSTLPEGISAEDAGKNTASEVACTPDGRFLYVSNRGNDSVACFKILFDGTLTLRDVVPVHGKCPRHFAVSPSGKFLLAAGQESDNISLFRIHPDTGLLTFLSETAVPVSPVCVLFGRSEAAVSVCAEEILKELETLKVQKPSPNWDSETGYAWTATMKRVKTMEPADFPEELILARISAGTLEQLQMFIQLGFAMDERSQDGEGRDFVREMTMKAVLQHVTFILDRLGDLNAAELKTLLPITRQMRENVERVLTWNANDPSLLLLHGWMIHFTEAGAAKEDASESEEKRRASIFEPEAQKELNAGIEIALRLGADYDQNMLLAKSLMARADWSVASEPEKAIADVERAASLDPSLNLDLSESKIMIFVGSRQYEKALTVVEERISELESAEKTEVKEDSETSAEETAKSPAEALKAMEDAKEAEDAKEEKDAKIAKMHRLRLELLTELSRWEPALEEVNFLLKKTPRQTDILVQKLQILAALEKLQDCIAVLDVLVEENPLEAQFNVLRGRIYYALNEPEKALADFSQALVIGGENEEVLTLKLGLLLEMNRTDEAQKMIDAQLEKNPEDVLMMLQSAMLSVEKKEYSRALEQALKAEKAADALAEALSKDGKTPSGEEKEKIQDFRCAVYSFLGNFYLMAGKHADSVRYYEKFMTLEAENALVLNNLAWIYATSPEDSLRNGKRALELAKKAVELNPEPGFRSTEAAAYAELGDFQKAKDCILQAMKDAEDNADLTASLQKEKANYDAGNPVREREERYELK